MNLKILKEMDKLSNKTIAICILARDCEESLKRNIPQIEILREYFSESYVVVIENDSKDDTKRILQDWAEKREKTIILSKDTNTVTMPSKNESFSNPGASFYRLEKMARYRNVYLNCLRDRKIKTDFVAVIDIDLAQIYPEEIIKNIINAPNDWSGLFANGKWYVNLFGIKIPTKYYDLLAYVPREADTYELTYKEIYYAQDDIERKLKSTAYVECKSAGGGICIYKYDAIIQGTYATQKNTKSTYNEAICEHISINKGASKFGKLYICKSMKVLYAPLTSLKMILKYLFLNNKNYVKLWETVKKKSFPA